MLDLHLVLILVPPAPCWMCSVSRSLDSPLDDLVRNHLQIVRPTDFGEEIDESGCIVQPVVTQFGRLVVPGEHVVIIVPSLAECECGYRLVLRWVDGAVEVWKKLRSLGYIGILGERMSRTVTYRRAGVPICGQRCSPTRWHSG